MYDNDNAAAGIPVPKIKSLYYDISSLEANFSNSSNLILASLNIQSLMSKHSDLKNFLLETSAKNIPIDILALQETWSIHHPHLVNIPGFNFIHHQRRGGGIGFYIREKLTFELVNEYSFFIPKIFECLSIAITINNKRTIFSSIYRSPSSNAADMQIFLSHLDNLLFNLSSSNLAAYICLDSNINILNMNIPPNQTHTNYMSTMTRKG